MSSFIENPGTVLIVDDVLPNRKLLNALLTRQGFTVFEAENGLQAVERVRQDDIQMIFMDIMMPVMDGYEATRLIKEYLGTHFVPIIMVTALDEQEGMARCIQAGADDYLTKPIDAVLLSSKILAMQRIRQLHELQREQNQQLQVMQARMNDEQRLAESILNKAISKHRDDINCLFSMVYPAELFSGDLVLQKQQQNGDWLVLVCDFTGHGLPAAVGTVPVTETFYSMAAKQLESNEILSELNYKLNNFLPTNMFMCCVMLEFHADTGKLDIWNGGMPAVLHLSAMHNRVEQLFESSDLPLGIIDKQPETFTPVSVSVSPGDSVVVYSDGLIEAENAAGERFGRQRLEQATDGLSGEQLYQEVISQWQQFQGDARQLDDVTLVVACF